jgi:phage I-like protein
LLDDHIVLFLTAVADVPQWIRILPMGEVALGDGREPFRVNREALESVLTAWEKRGNDLVIDYEHQTLDRGIAPAAGWIKTLEAREEGLWARVEWTERAQAYISSREYRYLSPVITLNKQTRQPMELLNAALTNCPAINNQTPLVARLGQGMRKIKEIDNMPNISQLNQEVEEKGIMINRIKSLLDMEPEAGDDQVIETIQTWKLARSDKLQETGTITEALGLARGTSAEKVLGRIEALKVEVEAGRKSRDELVRLQEQIAKDKAESMIQEALKTGRTSPEELAIGGGKLKNLAHNDPEFFQVLILGRPVHSIMPLNRLGIEEENHNLHGLNEEALILCKAMGISPEQFQKAKQSEKWNVESDQ